MSKIKETRTKLGLTQKEVSNLLGIPRRTIEDWEAEKRKCPDYVERLIVEKLVALGKSKNPDKEIEELTYDLMDAEHWYFEDFSCIDRLDSYKTAQNLYNIGYRKMYK